MRKHLAGVLMVSAALAALVLTAAPARAAITPVSGITVSGNDLTGITVGGYTVPVTGLVTGATNGSYNGSGPPTWPVGNADNFNVLASCMSQYSPFRTTMFGGALWSNTNGSDPDFFVFDNGPSGTAPPDSGTVQAVFADDSVGQAVSYGPANWGDTGFDTNTFQASGRDCLGMAIGITDLLDAAGDPLPSTATIKGLRFVDADIDPTCICAVEVPEPVSLTLLGVGAAGVLLRRRRR